MNAKLNTLRHYLFLFLLCTIFSCQDIEVDKKFDSTPTERIENQNNELRNALVSSPAFRAIYFPNDREYGGFTFYLKFSENGEVTMSSDYDTTTFAKKTTLYSVKQIATSTLIFVTKNHIHKLSDNFFPATLVGSGFEGHSQFTFIEYDETSGTIYFGEPRSESRLTLEPITEEIWNDAENLVEVSRENRQNLQPTLTRPVFFVLSYSNGSESFSYNLEYDQLRRSFDASFLGDNIPGPEFFEFGIAGTVDGLRVSPQIQFNDNVFEDFDYIATEDHFISTDGDATLIISPSTEPAVVSNYHEQFAQINSGVPQFYYEPNDPNIGDGILTSPAFHKLFYDDVKVPGGESAFILFEFNFTGDPVNCPCRLVLPGNTVYCYQPAIIRDNILYLEYTGPLGGIAAFQEERYEPLLQFFGKGHDKGIIIEGRGDFVSEDGANRFGNPSVTITSLNDPTLRVYGLAGKFTG